MGFANVAELVAAEDAGRVRYATYRKVPAVVTGAGTWYDYSMAPGNPAPQYYAATPLVAQTLSRSADGGIPHGGDVAPAQKFLRRVTSICVTAGRAIQRFTLCDYLLYYPFIDMGTADEQVMTNALSLTRYTDGDGVQIMAVLVAPNGLVGDTFTVAYTNQDGVAGRVTPAHTMSTAIAVNGTILTTQQSGAGRFGPFLALQSGDTGVRSIESVQCAAGTDVGLFTLVLVRPLASWINRGIDAPVERDFYLDGGGLLPRIEDDAYLNMIVMPSGSLSGAALIGDMTFAWDDGG
jgi:hypothetical protein